MAERLCLKAIGMFLQMFPGMAMERCYDLCIYIYIRDVHTITYYNYNYTITIIKTQYNTFLLGA